MLERTSVKNPQFVLFKDTKHNFFNLDFYNQDTMSRISDKI